MELSSAGLAREYQEGSGHERVAGALPAAYHSGERISCGWLAFAASSDVGLGLVG